VKLRIGIDTVTLKGEGFQAKVEVGQLPQISYKPGETAKAGKTVVGVVGV